MRKKHSRAVRKLLTARDMAWITAASGHSQGSYIHQKFSTTEAYAALVKMENEMFKDSYFKHPDAERMRDAELNRLKITPLDDGNWVVESSAGVFEGKTLRDALDNFYTHAPRSD